MKRLNTWTTRCATVGVLTFAATSVMPYTAIAQNQNRPQTTATQRDQNHEQRQMPKLEKANELIGRSVKNAQGEELGTIEDIVLDQRQQRVTYAVLSFGGFLGFGDKLFAIPWQALQSQGRDKALILDLPREQLKDAPGFDEDHWPDMANPEWARNVDKFYQNDKQSHSESARELNNDSNPSRGLHFWTRRLTKIIGTTVRNEDGQKLGEIEDVVLHARDGKLGYAVLSLGGFLDWNNKLVAAPWSALESEPRLGTFVLNADKQTLESLAFNESDYPDFSSPQYGRRISKWFNVDSNEVAARKRGESDHQTMIAAWKAGSDYNRQYDPSQTVTRKGTIASVGTFRPEWGAAEGLRLKIKTDDGRTVTVEAGPKAFAEQQDMRFHYGDDVSVKGVEVMTWHGSVLMAGSISKGDQTLELRDDQGKPQWNTDQLTSTVNP